ncbi:MAG TPA: MBL fold metallo-hydrolase, partial [Nitriliruptorales bacterium]
TDVDHLFFTHHHFDHDADYPCFLLTRWDQSIGTEDDLNVHGPRVTEKLTRDLIGEGGAFEHDWRARIEHPGSQRVHVLRGGTLPRVPPYTRVHAKDHAPGLIAEGDGWRVTASVAVHAEPWLDSLAYRLDVDGRSIVFTGDTEPCEPVTELARGADLMLCMCWGLEDRLIEDGETRGVCGTRGAASMAREAGVDRLMLVHTGAALDGHGEEAIADAGTEFPGEVLFAAELDTLDL